MKWCADNRGIAAQRLAIVDTSQGNWLRDDDKRNAENQLARLIQIQNDIINRHSLFISYRLRGLRKLVWQ